MIRIIFVIVFAFVLTLISRWTAGREYYVRKLGPIVPRYTPPPWLTPAEGGYLDNDRFDARDLVATLYDRTQKWYVSLQDNGWTPMLSIISRHGHQFFKAFEYTLRDRIFVDTNQFDLDQMSTYGRESKDELFDLIRLSLDSSCQEWYRAGPWYSRQWRAFTPAWAELYYQVQCYKQFITTVEIDKLNHLAKSDPTIITQAMPRAIVFGCETKFAQLVEHIEMQVWDRMRLSDNHLTSHILHSMIELYRILTTPISIE